MVNQTWAVNAGLLPWYYVIASCFFHKYLLTFESLSIHTSLLPISGLQDCSSQLVLLTHLVSLMQHTGGKFLLVKCRKTVIMGDYAMVMCLCGGSLCLLENKIWQKTGRKQTENWKGIQYSWADDWSGYWISFYLSPSLFPSLFPIS